MKVYIAGPFFNPEQRLAIGDIEDALHKGRIAYYSPRYDSGSANLSPEDRKDPRKWQPVFDSNIEAMNECDVMVAVIDYLMPPDFGLHVMSHTDGSMVKPVNIPDSGTVFEMGYFAALKKPIIGYYINAPKTVNLMLSHTVDAFCIGPEMLKEGFAGWWDDSVRDQQVPTSMALRLVRMMTSDDAYVSNQQAQRLFWEKFIYLKDLEVKIV